MSPVAATTSYPPMTVVFSRPSPITIIFTMAPTSVGITVLGQHDVVLPPKFPKGHNEVFSWPCHCATAATNSVPDAFSCMHQLCHGSPWVSFLFQN